MKDQFSMTSFIFLLVLVPTFSFSQDKHYTKALRAYEQDQHQIALKHLEKSSKVNPSSVESILLKSEVLYTLHEYEKVVDLLKGMKELPREYKIILSESLYMSSQFEEAKESSKTLLNEEDSAVIFNNIGASFYNEGVSDSAIYFIKKAIDADPLNGLYQFNLGAAYSDNDEADNACGQYFIASKLSYDEATEFYEDENCDSWKEQWLEKLSGRDVFSIENTMFPLIKDKVIVTHRTYLFDESGKQRQLKLIGLKRINEGAVFKFIDDQGHTTVRWSDKQNKDWTLKGVKRFDEL
jgi:tetratricopeptide (TPR) repeat protein